MLTGSYWYVLRNGAWVADNPRSTNWKRVPYVSTSIATAITLTHSATITNGTGATVTATVKTTAGAAVPAGTVVTLKIGTASATASTNSSGVASATVTPNASGSQTVSASYPGSGNYLSSSRTATVTVARKKMSSGPTNSSWSKCFNAAGTARNDALYHGQYSSTNGLNKSWICWPSVSIPSTAVSIVAKVKLNNNHWYMNNGGTLSYGIHSLTTNPTTIPSTPAVKGSVTGWAYGAVKEFTVTGWTATTRGIAILAKTTSQSEYGHFSNVGADATLTLTWEE